MSNSRLLGRTKTPKKSNRKIQYRLQILAEAVLLLIGSLSPALGQTEYINNGGFESGVTADWNMVGPIVLTTAPHTGTRNALMGETANSTDTMYQAITIPNNATAANLTYWYNITSSDTGPTANDILTVSIQNSNGSIVLAPVDTKSNVNRDPAAGNPNYHQKSVFDLLPYKGQQIRVHFKVVMNGTLVTSFRIDDVSVLVTTATVPTVQTLAADLIATNSARLNSSVNPNGASTTIYFQYGLTASYGSTTISGNIGTSSGNYATSTSGLTPNTLYHFRIVAYNAGGTNFGNDLTFTTLAMQSPPAVQTLAADLIATNSARLNSSVNPNGASTTIYFQYGLTTDYGNTTISGNIGTTSGNYATSPSGLTPNTLYHFRIVAYNAGGTNLGNDLTFTTLAMQSPPAVQTLAADLITTNSARLNSSVNPIGANTTIYFQYGLTTSYGSTTISGDIGTVFQNYATSVTNLSPNALYHFRIVAYNSGGTNVGNDLTFTTLAPTGAGLSVSPLSLTFSSSARSVVDLLVTYTPAASAEAGGDANLLNEIAAAVKQSNEAYVNSQINHRLRLLSIDPVAYVEAVTNVGGIGADIGRLVDKSDGYLNSVHSLRDQKGADVVALIEANNTDQGGIAKAMTNVSHSFESDALCIVRRPAMISDYFGLPHEIGHIMGCAHDHAEALREQARGEPGIGAYPYSYGYLLPGNSYGDIMSYTPLGVSRIPYFSNPDVLYGGVPTGVSGNQPASSANTALTMNNTASTVAGFRNTVYAGNVITISNNSASQISVTSISPETPAPWLAVSPQGSFSINAGAAQDVIVQVDYGLAPNGHSNVRLLIVTNNASANPILGGIAVIVDNDTPPPTRVISLSGNLAFGNVTVGTSAQNILTIANNGNSTLTVSSISYPSGFSGNWSGTIPQGNSQNVNVTFSPVFAINYGGNNLVVNSDKTSGTENMAVSGIGIDRPILRISQQGSNLVFTWPADVSGFTLEHTTNLPPTGWTSNTILPAIVNGQYTVTNAMTDGSRFYRLKK